MFAFTTAQKGRIARLPFRRLMSLMAAAVAGLVVMATASPAHASIWQLRDGFEVNPSLRWSFGGAGEGEGGGTFVTGNAYLAHSGTSYGYFDQFGSGWFSVGRNVHITPAQVHRPLCAVKFWLARVTASPVVSVDVIDPATWTYIAFYQVTGPGASGAWQSYTVGSWRANHTDVFLRFTVSSTPGTLVSTKIDDVVVSCSY